MVVSVKGKEIKDLTMVKLKDLTPPLFSSLLVQINLRAPKAAKDKAWANCYKVLQCSELYMGKFEGVLPEAINCKLNDELDCVMNLSSGSGVDFLSLFSIDYPCNLCHGPVSDEKDDTGNGLQCSTCKSYYHNSCAAPEYRLSPELLVAIEGSPVNVCVYCPKCIMKGQAVTLASLVERVDKLYDLAEKKPLASQLLFSPNNPSKTHRFVKPVPSSVSKTERDERTRVVIKPLDVKIVSSRNIKSAINKRYKDEDIFLVNCFAPAGGSFVLEMESKEMAEKLDGIWDTTLFSGNKGLKKLSSVTENCIGVIKDIEDAGITEEELVAEIKDQLPLEADSVVEVFKTYNRRTRKKEFTGTVKMTFKDRASLVEATKSRSIKINHQRQQVQEWCQKPKVKYCYKCLKIGHVAHRCRNGKQNCGKCNATDHQQRECSVTDPNKFKCGHCDGKHATGSSFCSTMKEEMDKIMSWQHHG